jgi:hypothetical protein
LWFVEEIGDKIGRVTTAGVVTELALPTVSDPEGITARVDGAIWFARQTDLAPVPCCAANPATNIAASGYRGDPFTPSSFQYQLSTATSSQNYTIIGIPSWLNANIISGAATTTPTTATFSLSNVGSLAPANTPQP